MIKTMQIADFLPSDDKVIWDVRDPEAYQREHIAHAVNRPLECLTAELLAGTTGDVYVLCGGGTKAQKAAALLDELDPNRTIVHVLGGTRGAKALGWVLVTDLS